MTWVLPHVLVRAATISVMVQERIVLGWLLLQGAVPLPLGSPDSDVLYHAAGEDSLFSVLNGSQGKGQRGREYAGGRQKVNTAVVRFLVFSKNAHTHTCCHASW